MSEGKASSVNGLPNGSTVLITGQPGAGKTTFALAIVRSLMAEDLEAARGQKEKFPLLYYISLENDAEKLKMMFDEIGWFSHHDWVFNLDRKSLDTQTVALIVSEPQIDRPVPSSEEMVNTIFTKLLAQLPPAGQSETRPTYLILDSLTSLVQDGGQSADRRRQVHEILFRLHKIFSKDSGSNDADQSLNPGNLKLSILLSERRDNSSGTSIPSVEEYLSDIVFRLDLKTLPLGRRLRSLEVVKSLGTNMTIGEHTWQICSSRTFKTHVLERNLRERIWREAARFQDSDVLTSNDIQKDEDGHLSLPVRVPGIKFEPGLLQKLAQYSSSYDPRIEDELISEYLKGINPALKDRPLPYNHPEVSEKYNAVLEPQKKATKPDEGLYPLMLNRCLLAQAHEKSFAPPKWGTIVIFTRLRSHIELRSGNSGI